MRAMYAVRGIPGVTTKITASDSAQTLTSAGMSFSIGGRNAIGALITIDKPGGSGNDIRCSFGDNSSVTPTTTLGHIMYAGDSIFLDNPVTIKTFQFINRSAGNNAVLHVTMEYEAGSGVTV